MTDKVALALEGLRKIRSDLTDNTREGKLDVMAVANGMYSLVTLVQDLAGDILVKDASCMGQCSTHPESSDTPCPACPAPPVEEKGHPDLDLPIKPMDKKAEAAREDLTLIVCQGCRLTKAQEPSVALRREPYGVYCNDCALHGGRPRFPKVCKYCSRGDVFPTGMAWDPKDNTWSHIDCHQPDGDEALSVANYACYICGRKGQTKWYWSDRDEEDQYFCPAHYPGPDYKTQLQEVLLGSTTQLALALAKLTSARDRVKAELDSQMKMLRELEEQQ